METLNASSLDAVIAIADGDPTAARVCQQLAQDACPICALTAAGVQRYIDGFLYESVNDPTLREKLAQAQGYCYRHAWQVYDTDGQTNGGIGVTVLYLDFTERAVEALKSHLRYAPIVNRLHTSWWMRAFRRLTRKRMPRNARITAIEPRALCPACRVEHEVEESYLASLGRLLPKPDFRALYATSRGLCLPHLRKTLALVGAEERLFLAETTRAKLAALLHQVQEYNRKHIWDFRAEPKWPEEQIAWIRTIAFEVGEKSQERGIQIR